MRDPNRLYNFYDKLRIIHMKYFPDWRFGQLVTNFLESCATDIFYWEEDKFIDEMEKFAEHVTERQCLVANGNNHLK